MGRILFVTDDALEWQAVSRELDGRFDLLRANGKDQAMALLEREAELVAIVAYWGPLESGADLMRGAQARKPKVPRVLISERPQSPEAQALIAEGVVRTVVSDPGNVASALGAAPAGPGAGSQRPVRSEPRTPVKLQLGVSTTAWDGFQPLHTKDASRGGVYFFYAKRVVPPSGSRCSVQLGSATVEGVVAHVITARLATATRVEAGFGVSFSAPQPAEWWAPLIVTAPKPVAVAAPAAAAVPGGGTTRAAPTPKELEGAKNFSSLAMTLFKERNYAAARQKFELAARLAPDPRLEAMQACCNGEQYARSGLADKARDAFERALLLDPGCAAAVAALKVKR